MKGLRDKDLVDGKEPKPEPQQSCPRCESPDTKFCYYNNYSISQPRYLCKNCKRYWTRGGSLRNVPIGSRFIDFKHGGGLHRRSNSFPNNSPVTTTANSICYRGQTIPRSFFMQHHRQQLINRHPQPSLQQQPQLPTNLATNTTNFGAATSGTINNIPTININRSSASIHPVISSSLSRNNYLAASGGFSPSTAASMATIQSMNQPANINVVKAEVDFVGPSNLGPIQNFHVPYFTPTASQQPVVPEQNLLHQSQQLAFNVGNILNQPSNWPSSDHNTSTMPKQEWHQNVLSPGYNWSTTAPTNTTTTTTTTNTTNATTNNNNCNNLTAGLSSVNPTTSWPPYGDLGAVAFGKQLPASYKQEYM